MPIYEYQCLTCGKQTEVLQRLSDAPLETCEDCGGELKKLISAPAFQFKGSGWYVTDYAGKGNGKDGKDKASKSSESKTKESKSESSGSSSSGSSSSSDSGSKSTSTS